MSARGDSINALFAFERAQAFPNYRIREASTSLFSLLQGMPPEIVLDRIDAMLEDDPYGPRLNFYKTVHEIRRGRLDLAEPALARLQRSLPNGVQTVNAKKVYRKAKAKQR